MFPPQLLEAGVVSLLNKDVFAVVTSTVDVVEDSIRDEWDVSGHIVLLARPDRFSRKSCVQSFMSAHGLWSARVMTKPVRSLIRIDFFSSTSDPQAAYKTGRTAH